MCVCVCMHGRRRGSRRSVPQGMGVWAGAGRIPKQAKRTGRLASTALFGDGPQRRRSGNGRKQEHLHEGRAQCVGEAENQVQERRPAAQARFRVARWRDGGLGGLACLGLRRGDEDGGWGGGAGTRRRRLGLDQAPLAIVEAGEAGRGTHDARAAGINDRGRDSRQARRRRALGGRSPVGRVDDHRQCSSKRSPALPVRRCGESCGAQACTCLASTSRPLPSSSHTFQGP